MRFVDEVEIEVNAGRGGNGCVAFRREAGVPLGGPAGGDGGDGGSVVIKADTQVGTLLDLRYQKHYRAQRGTDGGGRDRDGRGGESCEIRVPCGTIVRDAECGDVLGDLSESDSQLIVARGGRGGRGNLHFVTATHRAPREAEPGESGECRRLALELKLLADVGLVGLPNSGKSTLIAVISKAKPKIADYPFTTLVPNLGVVRLSSARDFVVADVPGLIEGAAQGAGLGHRFLRHLERTRVMVYLLDDRHHEVVPYQASTDDALSDFLLLEQELRAYRSRSAHLDEVSWLPLTERPFVIALNKCDALEPARRKALLERLRTAGLRAEIHPISAVSGEGVSDLLEAIWKRLAADPKLSRDECV